MSRALKLGLLTGLEWLFLLALWMAFVSTWSKAELLIGMLAATIGAVADAVVKKEGLAKFKPKLSWVLLIFWEPWYVAQGAYFSFKAFFCQLLGVRPRSGFQVAEYDAVGDDERSAAKRALAITYLTIPPNSIVIGIDRERKQALIHHIVPPTESTMARKLGVKA